MANFDDKELQQYRDLVAEPDQYEDGFSFKTVLGALFLGFIMLPGAIYLALMVGANIGPAARWVTIILFAEVARRSMKSLRTQEVYLLFYMTGIALGGQLIGTASNGGFMMTMLWNQFLAQSPSVEAMGIDVPYWVAPSSEAINNAGRTFFTADWMIPILFLCGMMILQRIDHWGLGYALYRLTAHVERLPFPMAPVGVLGISALADVQDKQNRWRWKWFSIGGAIGLFFGMIYIGVPALTDGIFGTPVKIIPIPFLDLTSEVSTRSFMPATPLNIVFDLTFIIMGMVLPFWAVVGGFIGLIVTFILNPVLYQQGVLTTWKPAMGMVDTIYANTVDFYLSFGIGLSLSIFGITMWTIIRPFFRGEKKGGLEEGIEQEKKSIFSALAGLKRNRERGDLSIWLALGIYIFSTIGYIALCCFLMWDSETGTTRFPWIFFLGFGFIYQPIISYVSAKLEGMIGQAVHIPLIREAAFILSGYTGSEIWFAPIPINDYGRTTQEFRVMELTGTNVKGVIKTEFVVVPIVIVATIIFSQMIWGLGAVPGPSFPYAHELWELQAKNFALQATATKDGTSEFMEAIKFDVITYGLLSGGLSYFFLTLFGLPTFLVYGVVRGLGQSTPGNAVPELIGALVGRFILQKKFGHQQYKQYISVLFAGFTAGMGLIGMAAVAFLLIAKSTTTMGY